MPRRQKALLKLGLYFLLGYLLKDSRYKAMKLFPRRVARFAATQAVFQGLMCPSLTAKTIIHEFTAYRFSEGHYALFDEVPYPVDYELFCTLVEGALTKGEEIEQSLVKVLPEGWSIDRLETTTRCIFRCAAFELAYQLDTPKEVIISEYVSIAHSFLPGKGPSFINGVLESLSRHLRG